MRRFLPVLFLVACSHSSATPAAPQAAVHRPSKDPCKEAARFRRSGFDKILNLDLKGARADFNKSLELDPGNTGALQQLQVIDAMESGNEQAGASAQNNNLNSQVTPSKCQEAAAKPQSAVAPRGEADIDGQIGITSNGKDNLTRGEIHEVIRRVQPELSRCYARELQHEPTLSGDMVVHFDITATGQVKDAETENSTVDNSQLEDCVQGIVAKLVFPKERGAERSVSYPISFR